MRYKLRVTVEYEFANEDERFSAMMQIASGQPVTFAVSASVALSTREKVINLEDGGVIRLDHADARRPTSDPNIESTLTFVPDTVRGMEIHSMVPEP